MLCSRAFSALEPRPITAITAAVPIMIAREVKKDLVALDLIEEIADINDSLNNIIQNYMEVLWIKDGNIGHEKQVKVLLDELSKTLTLNIDSREIKGIFPIFTYLEDVQEKYYDLIIGAGHKTYSSLLDTKKYQKEGCIT